MSRSNPTTTATNPAVRWHEWKGSTGTVRYYDKDKKENVDVGSKFTFMLLDQLAKVGGWHNESDSGIYSNEVRDTRQDALIVKAFKGGVLAEGIYAQIKDRLHTQGGRFVANLYIAFKLPGNGLVIGSLQLKGAALNAWVEFTKDHRADLYTKAITISGFTEGKKGQVVYRVPTFTVSALTDETQAAALALDTELQAFLREYLARTTRDKADTPTEAVDEPPADEPPPTVMLDDDDIPF